MVRYGGVLKTVSQIAREYGVAEQTLYKRIKRLSTELSTFTVKGANGIIQISPENEAILTKGLVLVDNRRQPFNDVVDNRCLPVDNQVDNGRQPEKESGDTVDTLIDMLKSELDVKNKQIEDLTKANRDLTAALENTTSSLKAAQALHAGTMQANLISDGGGEVKDDVDHQPEEDVGVYTVVSFFKRFFTKRGG